MTIKNIFAFGTMLVMYLQVSIILSKNLDDFDTRKEYYSGSFRIPISYPYMFMFVLVMNFELFCYDGNSSWLLCMDFNWSFGLIGNFHVFQMTVYRNIIWMGHAWNTYIEKKLILLKPIWFHAFFACGMLFIWHCTLWVVVLSVKFNFPL